MIEGKVQGNQFENIFERQCHMQGIAVRKRPLSCKWKGAGQLQLVAGELDFEIIFDGITSNIDTKTFDGEVLIWSCLNEDQVNLAKYYMENGVNAGYVVWFRVPNAVVFFNGVQLSVMQKGDSLHWSQGEYLGPYEDFCLGNLFI